MKQMVTAAAVVLALGIGSGQASAEVVTWTDWTAASTALGSASGTLPGINVSYAGQVSGPTQTSVGNNYWNPATPFLSATVGNAPPCCDSITLTGGTGTGKSTLTFSSPIKNPIMAIVSLGQSGVPVDFEFEQLFDVLSSGDGYGVIQFNGTFWSISWTTPNAEFWYGFTVGQAQVPEPATLGLFGMAIASGIVRRVRRRR